MVYIKTAPNCVLPEIRFFELNKIIMKTNCRKICLQMF